MLIFENLTEKPATQAPLPETALDNSRLEESETKELTVLLNSFHNLFSVEPGLTHITSYIIDTRDAFPTKGRLYRYDRTKTKILEYHIQKNTKARYNRSFWLSRSISRRVMLKEKWKGCGRPTRLEDLRSIIENSMLRQNFPFMECHIWSSSYKT